MELQNRRNRIFSGRVKNTAVKCFLIAFSFLLLCGLTSCRDNGWKKYDTPERFLEHAIEHHYVTVSSTELEGDVMDYGLKIKDLILEVGNFETTSKRDDKSEHYISYKILIALSTAGPNYSNLYLYDNGYVEIVYKSALGRQHWFYYSFDPEKAATLVEEIENRIIENQQRQDESD